MKQKRKYRRIAILIAVGVTTVFLSCNSGTDESTSTTTDTATVMNVDTSNAMMDTGRMATDTSLMNKPDKTAVEEPKGVAKPNPTKKGMKGKVAVLNSPVKKGSSMEADKSGVYSNVEVIPSFPGGNKGLQKFFDDNLEYPNDASSEGVEGTVRVSFVVDETGKVSTPEVIGDKQGYGLETEALRVVNKMPTWNPGKLKGKNVKTRYTLPVRFVLY